MGTSRWSPEDWDAYVDRTACKSAAEIFGSCGLNKDLDPREIGIRESCDSDANPNSTPVIVAVDETGSMGILAETLIRKGLGTLIEEIYARKPVSDPHIMCMAVGDAWYDRAPLQVTQFESDIGLAAQLSRFWIEGRGGGNNYESYNLPWYFAATRTKCDAFLKRGKKGYLFTVGDEPPPPVLLANHVNRFLGENLEQDISSRDLYAMASRTWEIFHIMIEEGTYYKLRGVQTQQSWQSLLGQRAIPLSDHEKLAEVIVSTIEINEGSEAANVASSWSGSTALVVSRALQSLKKTDVAAVQGVIRL